MDAERTQGQEMIASTLAFLIHLPLPINSVDFSRLDIPAERIAAWYRGRVQLGGRFYISIGHSQQ